MLNRCVYFCLCLLLPISAQAFDLEQLKKMAEDPELMQKQFESMSKGFADASSCINMESINKMKSDSEAMQNEIKALCAKGDRSKAQKTAMQYSRQILSSKEYKELKECGDKFMSHMPPGLLEDIKSRVETASSAEEGKATHICDSI